VLLSVAPVVTLVLAAARSSSIMGVASALDPKAARTAIAIVPVMTFMFGFDLVRKD